MTYARLQISVKEDSYERGKNLAGKFVLVINDKLICDL